MNTEYNFIVEFRTLAQNDHSAPQYSYVLARTGMARERAVAQLH
jgi:hypothetical protein